ncbi:MAG: hypothetical protein ACLUNV_02005 [Sutterella wadsworthensis]
MPAPAIRLPGPRAPARRHKATAVTADQKGGWDGYSLALGFEHLPGRTRR